MHSELEGSPFTQQSLIAQLEAGARIKYIFFWGHTATREAISKHCFSQWFERDFIVDGINYPTAEHWMMAEKARLFGDEEVLEQILKSSKPGEAKDLGRRVRDFDNETWNAKRFDIVVQGNFHKFQQHDDLRNFLIQTNERVIVEASPVDVIWGIGIAEDSNDAMNPARWKGPNLLGFALMEVRHRMKNLGNRQ
ncbi:MAG: NADAR family protein [Bacteroidia bacterium]